MNIIKTLPENTIKKIAAGEVIERPASVLKELIENSIDAKANKIRIGLEDGGIKTIQISDNGTGMSQEDAKESFKLHTTSKISTIDDLEKINSFGFRGEALASISSVSEIIIHTYKKGSEAIKLVIEEGKLLSQENIPRVQGTTVIVRDIFRHLPARKKFLRSSQTEYRYSLMEVIKIALRNPDVDFEVEHNKKITLKLNSRNNYKERILDIFPNIHQRDLIEINLETPIAKIHGFIIHPNKLSIDRSKQYIFVNNRFISERSLAKAIKEGYFSTISKEKNPGYFINYNIDPHLLDINIHPRKLEVKIERINELFSLTRNAVESALKSKLQNDFKEKMGSIDNITSPDNIKSFNKGFDIEHLKSKEAKTNIIPLKEQFLFSKPSRNIINKSIDFTEQILNPSVAEFKYYQIFNTYILFEKDDIVQIIDQHAADERVNFEKIIKKINKGALLEKKNLLIPMIIDFSHEEVVLINENLETLAEFGFDIDVFGEKTIKINSFPEFAKDINPFEVISQILKTLREFSDDEIKEIKFKIASSLACHGSIRAGRELTNIEIEKLVTDLFACDEPYSCPHGRPIIWTLTKKDFEKKFNRCK